MSRGINANSFVVVVKSVPSPGTAVQMDSYIIPDGLSLWITARANNVSQMYIAFSQADAQTNTTRKELVPGQSFELKIDQASRVWYDAALSTDYLEFFVQKSSQH